MCFSTYSSPCWRQVMTWLTTYTWKGTRSQVGFVCSWCFVSVCPSVQTFCDHERLHQPLHFSRLPWTHLGLTAQTPPWGSGKRLGSVASGSGGFHLLVAPGNITEFAVKRAEWEFQCSSLQRADTKGKQKFIQTGKKACPRGACLHSYHCLMWPQIREAISRAALLSLLSLLQEASHG